MRAFARSAFLLSSTLVLVVGCVDNRGRVDRDAGGNDECPPGTVCLMDSGPGPTDPPESDSGSGSGCVPEGSASACSDGLDNDCDGHIDCNDFNCCGLVTCGSTTACGDMVDPPEECDPFTYPEPIPSTCLPRCTAATETAANSCPDSDCFYATLDADTTPPVTTELRRQDGTSAGTIPIGCRDCVVFQVHSCAYDFCPSLFAAWVSCDPDTDAGGCAVEQMALDTCLDASSGYEGCVERELARCFP